MNNDKWKEKKRDNTKIKIVPTTFIKDHKSIANDHHHIIIPILAKVSRSNF